MDEKRRTNGWLVRAAEAGFKFGKLGKYGTQQDFVAILRGTGASLATEELRRIFRDGRRRGLEAWWQSVSHGQGDETAERAAGVNRG